MAEGPALLIRGVTGRTSAVGKSSATARRTVAYGSYRHKARDQSCQENQKIRIKRPC